MIENHLPNTKADDGDLDMEEIALPAKYSKTYGNVIIGDRTKLPIKEALHGEVDTESNSNWLKEGRHLDMAADKTGNNGIVYVSATPDTSVANNDKKYDQTETTDIIDKKADRIETKDNEDTKLYPLEFVSSEDTSPDRIRFVTGLYNDFEDLLKNSAFKTYISDTNDFGVPSLMKTERKERTDRLKWLLTNLIKSLKELMSSTIKSDAQNDSKAVKYEELINILNLLHATKFSEPDESIILFQMWVNRADIQPDDQLVSDMENASHGTLYKNMNFWSKYLKTMIFRGYFAQAISAIDESGYENFEQTDPDLYALVKHLKSLIASYDPMKFSQYLKAFMAWKQRAANLREAAIKLTFKNVEIGSQLVDIVASISGVDSALRKNCGRWYEYFLLEYMFEMPSMKKISEYVDKAQKSFSVDTVYSWETICLNIFSEQYLKAISALETLDRSVSTYTAILLSASGLLKSYSNISLHGKDIKSGEEEIQTSIDQMIEDLALSYLSSKELFSTGTGILILTDDSKARKILSEMLPNYKIESNDDFEWCLSICAKLMLPMTAKQIYNTQGEILLDNGYEYESLCCFSEAGNTKKVVSSVWQIFENLLLGGNLVDTLLNEKIDKDEIDSPILRQALSPLALLRNILSTEGKTIPFEKFVELIQFRYLPAHYKAVLLLLLLPYFNTNTFSLDQLIKIIEILNVYEKQINDDTQCAELSGQSYDVAVSRKDVGASKGTYDWRNLEKLPSDSMALILEIRKLIAFEISFKFLEE